MRRNSILIFAFSFIAALAAAFPQTQSSQAVQAAETDSYIYYLPMVAVPDVPAGTQLLQNGSFEQPWENLPPTPGFLINQQPKYWTLTWVQPGQPLYGSSDLANGVPECVHKLPDQLPPEERFGGSKALVLDGEVTYKIFGGQGLFFGAELKQTVSGVRPGLPVRLTAPILLTDDLNYTDPYAAEVGVWVNGVGNWANLDIMESRIWHYHTYDTVVPSNGEVEVLIRVKTKYGKIDFFMDDITLEVLDH